MEPVVLLAQYPCLCVHEHDIESVLDRLAAMSSLGQEMVLSRHCCWHHHGEHVGHSIAHTYHAADLKADLHLQHCGKAYHCHTFS